MMPTTQLVVKVAFDIGISAGISSVVKKLLLIEQLCLLCIAKYSFLGYSIALYLCHNSQKRAGKCQYERT